MWAGATQSVRTASPPSSERHCSLGYSGPTLTAHKAEAKFIRYVHTEDDPARKAAEVANRRKTDIAGRSAVVPSASAA